MWCSQPLQFTMCTQPHSCDQGRLTKSAGNKLVAKGHLKHRRIRTPWCSFNNHTSHIRGITFVFIVCHIYMHGPSGCCSLRECAHPPAAYPRRSIAAGPGGYLRSQQHTREYKNLKKLLFNAGSGSHPDPFLNKSHFRFPDSEDAVIYEVDNDPGVDSEHDTVRREYKGIGHLFAREKTHPGGRRRRTERLSPTPPSASRSHSSGTWQP